MSNVHGTCVAFGRFGVLLRGPSGSGKSALALRLIDAEGFGLGQHKLRARLVADDQVVLQTKGTRIMASPPPNLAGSLEIRGIGIVSGNAAKTVELCLVVDLLPHTSIQRMPESVDLSTELLGVALPRLSIDAQTPDAAAKLRAAVVHLKRKKAF